MSPGDCISQMHKHTPDNSERGVATLEFALTASFFFMMILVVIVGAHVLWIHNSLVEATRGTTPIVPGLKASNVTVTYSVNTAPPGQPPTDFGVARGTVSVKIQNYDYTAVVPVANTIIHLPPYQTTVMGESAGFFPGTCGP